MSNFRAIATVTATLQRTLQEAIQADVAGATVTTVRPAEGQNTQLPVTGVNVYLYQVSPNPNWRNNDLPTRRADGELAQRPQAALNLHYLLSFYGSDIALEPQRLLGSTAAHLHSQPLLTRAQIDATAADATKPFLASSDLADAVDLIRFTPLSMSLEELSRLWSVFLQVRYVLSVTYQAAVVLIEPQLAPRAALPAREVNLASATMQHTTIARVVAASGEDDPIVAGGAIVLEGDALSADVVVVEIDGAAVAALDSVSAQRIELTLPAALSAGPHALRVRHGVQIGAPGVRHLAFSSNVAPFMLHPAITQTAGADDIDITNVQGGGAAPRSANVRVGVSPQVAPQQLVTLQLLSGPAVAHTFMARPRAAASPSADFAIEGVAAGDYLFRVSVDGADSALEPDANGDPVGPQETIP